IRQRKPIFFRSIDEMYRSYPHLAETANIGPCGAIAAVPLISGDRAFGCLGFRFTDSRHVTPVERGLITDVADHCARALHRAILFDRERTARERAQTEILERTRADEATARLAAIVESSDDAIMSKDLDDLITSWNPGAERLYGYSSEEAIGKPISILIPRDMPHE